MGFFITGTIVQALPIQSGVSQKTGNQWQTAQYVVEHESGQYPKKMIFDVKGQKIQELNLQVGEQVTLHLNCDTREYNGRLFNSIDCWKVERQGQQQVVQQPQYQQQPVQQQFPPQVNAQGQPQYQQPAPGAAPFPPQQPAQQMQQPAQGQQGTLPFPPAQ